MANLVGTKWGGSKLGTAGGTVTWSVAGGGLDISRFGVNAGDSVKAKSFLNFDYESVIAAAFAEWSKYGDIEFKQVNDGGGAAGSSTKADIRIFFGEIPGGTAGYAFFPSAFGSAIAGDILIDTLDRWNNDQELFFNLMLHEIGHSLGLDHVSSKDSIMYSSVRKIGLQPMDIEGIQDIYGKQQPGDVPGSSPSTPPADDGSSNNNDDDGSIDNGHSDDDGHNHDPDDGHSHDPDDGHDPGNDPAPQGTPTSGDDFIHGSSKGEKIKSGTGDDTVHGGAGDDILKGNSGDDELEGDSGADKLRGGSGNDMLLGGSGDDNMKGGTGGDRFVFENGHGHDKILDFHAKSQWEKIDLSGVNGFNDIGDVMDAARKSGSHVIIDTGADSSIQLNWVSLGHLDASDFIF